MNPSCSTYGVNGGAHESMRVDDTPDGYEVIIYGPGSTGAHAAQDARSGPFDGLRSALGRWMARLSKSREPSGEAMSVRYQPAPANVYVERHHQAAPRLPLPPAPDPRLAFEDFSPSDWQRAYFSKLQDLLDLLESVPDQATAQYYQAAIRRLEVLMSQSKQLNERYETEFHELLNNNALNKLYNSPGVAPHEVLRLRRINTFIEWSRPAQANTIAGASGALAILRWARRYAVEVLREQLPASEEGAWRENAIEKAMKGHAFCGMPLNTLKRIGHWLWRTEDLSGPDAVVLALDFTARCARRPNGLLPAMSATRVVERLAREGISREKAEAAAQLLWAHGTAELDDLTHTARTLCTCPLESLQTLGRSPVKINVCRDSIVESLPDLQGVLTHYPSASAGGVPPLPLQYWDDVAVHFFSERYDDPPCLVIALTPATEADPASGASFDGSSGATTGRAPYPPRRLPHGLPHALQEALTWARNHEARSGGSSSAPSDTGLFAFMRRTLGKS